MKNLPKVFISEPINSKGIEMLKDKVILIQAADTSKTTAMSLINGADAAILRATTIFDKEVITQGSKLKIIARTGIGVDNVDLKAAGEKGIYVCNTPGVNDETVAEHTMAMILALAKQIIPMDKAVRQQNWKERFSPNQMDIKGKRIGLIGYGKIGKATARICKMLGMGVLAFDPYCTSDNTGTVLTSDITDIFKECDFISLHCPAVASNQNMVNADLLKLMKKSAYLINTSRGELVDEVALTDCLKAGKIAGAALDVFKNEPLPNTHPFISMNNVILSPHVAGSTKESNERIAVAAAQAVIDTLEGRVPANICNREYLKSKIKI